MKNQVWESQKRKIDIFPATTSVHLLQSVSSDLIVQIQRYMKRMGARIFNIVKYLAHKLFLLIQGLPTNTSSGEVWLV